MRFDVRIRGRRKWVQLHACTPKEAAKKCAEITGKPTVVDVREWHPFLEWKSQRFIVAAKYFAETV